MDELTEYNDFCKNLVVGSILFNLDTTNLWPRYLLVIDITPMIVEDKQSFSVLLLGFERIKGEFRATDQCIKLTFEYYKNTLFLKPVGICKFSLRPEIRESRISQALITIYSNINLHEFIQKLNIRKPHLGRYGKDGKPIIKKTKNY